jgi:hypothetical protein
MFSVVLSVLLAANAPRTQVQLSLTPPLAVAQIDGVELNAFLIIKNADERLWCPQIQWEWSDGSISTEEGDCEPFADTTPAQRARVVSRKSRRIYGSGIVRLIVRLIKGGKVLKRVEGVAEIK